MKFEDARRALLSRKAALERVVAETLEEGSRVSDAHELEEIASERTAKDLAAALGKVEQRELQEIEAALLRIQQGTWGRCEVCQRAIGGQRLRALPETRRCAVCSAEAERLDRST
jgi:DnaK suppressor protein